MQYNKIYSIDCIKGMRNIKDETVDVVVTSPPYNIGKCYNSYQDNIDDNVFHSWFSDVIVEIKRILTANGSFFLNVGNKPSKPLWPIEIAITCSKHFALQNTIHWIKSISIPIEDVGDYPHMLRDISVGHFKPVNSQSYLNNCHEYIFHFTKSGEVPVDKLSIGVEYQDKSNVKRWKSAKVDLRDRGNTWFIPYETVRMSRPHPAPFPIKLPEYCIKIHGLNKTNLVVDPFMGIGSTALACLRLGIPYLGFELDEEYVKIAEDRIEHEKSKNYSLPKIHERRGRKLFRLIIEDLYPEDLSLLMKEARGTGGYQSLLRKLQRQYSEKDNRIVLEHDDVIRLARYIKQYGQGGFQGRLSVLMDKLKRVQADLDAAIQSYEDTN